MSTQARINFVELAPGTYEAQAFLTYTKARLVHSETAEDAPDGFSLVLSSHGNMSMFTMTDEDLGRLSELIETFRAGIKQTEGE